MKNNIRKILFAFMALPLLLTNSSVKLNAETTTSSYSLRLRSNNGSTADKTRNLVSLTLNETTSKYEGTITYSDVTWDLVSDVDTNSSGSGEMAKFGTNSTGCKAFTISTDNFANKLVYGIKINCETINGQNGKLSISYDGNSLVSKVAVTKETLTEISTSLTKPILGGADAILSIDFTNTNKTNPFCIESITIEYKDYFDLTMSELVVGYKYSPSEYKDSKVDVIELSKTTATSSSYATTDNVSFGSDARYYINNRKYSSSDMGFKSGESSGLISYTSSGIIKSIKIDFNTSTVEGRTLNVYLRKTAYDTPTDSSPLISKIYGNSGEATKGVLKEATYTSSNPSITIDCLADKVNYSYLGIRSSDGTIYVSKITITWCNYVSESLSSISNYNIRYSNTISKEVYDNLYESSCEFGYVICKTESLENSLKSYATNLDSASSISDLTFSIATLTKKFDTLPSLEDNIYEFGAILPVDSSKLNVSYSAVFVFKNSDGFFFSSPKSQNIINMVNTYKEATIYDNLLNIQKLIVDKIVEDNNND